MNDKIDIDICYTDNCFACDGSGVDHYDPLSGKYDKNYIGVCETCGGQGKIHKNNSLKNSKIVFECSCGYKEYDNKETLGFCPMCK